MKTNIKARITGLFICKTTIMVNKCEKILLYNFYFRQTAIVILSFMLSLSFYSFLLFYLTFFVLILLYLSGKYILFLPTYLGGTFFPLLDVSERNYFFRWGGGARAPSAPPPPPHLRTRLNKKGWWKEQR